MLLEDHHIITLRLLLEAGENVPPPSRLPALQSDLKTKLQLCRDGMNIYQCLLDAVSKIAPAEALEGVHRWLNAIREEYEIGLAMHEPLLELAMNAGSFEELQTLVKNHQFKPKVPVPLDMEERRRKTYPVMMRHCARRRLQRLGTAICKT